ncbi:MAG: hypothetical protein A2428_08485 [Bdellovibrionales bacterium RIFOXYC1_FULL_54_43]|nr:MAG: hypothetical protein A2428_08485 [Bdellovibrionales bacterium RIFOXYC1_FULL_54_43]OFZ80350.1 MAG: hypothetical protein A2603_13280 [Bdellovibrionales bacterium RIFOXYD1_FULL_55_31]
MKRRWFGALLICLWTVPAFAGGGLSVGNPCERTERWNFDASIPSDVQKEFNSFLAGRASAARSLAEAIAYRRDTPPGDLRSFSEYWIARTLLAAGLNHSAQAGFAALLTARARRFDSVGVSMAALGCLNRLVSRYPAMELPDELAAVLSDHLASAESESGRRLLRNVATLLLKQQIQQEKPRDVIHRTVALLRGGGAYESFALGLWAALNGDHQGTAGEMERFISAQSSLVSKQRPLERHLDQAHLLAGRAHFALRKYDSAARHFKLVRKNSNELPAALSELAWSSLASRSYEAAIGATLNLQAGGMRRVFAPESLMVLSIAMNELCQFPEALRALQQFHRGYEPSYRWLSDWTKKKRFEELYPLAVGFLKRKKLLVPDRVASEWVRSPYFIASQEQLNLLSEENAGIPRLSRSASLEQKRMGNRLRTVAARLLPRIKKERARGLSDGLRAELSRFVTDVIHYRRFRSASPVWRTLVANQEAFSAETRREARARIEKDLVARNRWMLGILDEVAENIKMVEVEIFDGASQDIVWQNAHPDYKQLVKNLSQERKEPAGKVWNWGRAPITSEVWTEVWEDELGSYKSSLFDNCSNKKKYLVIKKEGVSRSRKMRS